MTITQSSSRDIIADFADAIQSRKTSTARPSKIVIDFRNEKANNFEREIVEIPLELLRFRKDNGRIASDVMSFEKSTGLLKETDQGAQDKLGEFLDKKDPERTGELYNLILAEGQDSPAIATCDGFLIDGNRRRLVLEKLQQSHPENSAFSTMKVVLLPGSGDEGGPPTLLEIEQIENKYQLHSTGKAEYSGFDAALSIRQKEKRRFSLEAQMKGDPQFSNLNAKEFKSAVTQKRQELLAPLDCIDRYLKSIGREERYDLVSKGLGDSEGRWQAFIDYSNFYNKKLQKPHQRQALGIDEDEVGAIEDAAFKIIRLRDLSGIMKPHQAMRDMPKFCEHAKEELLAISNNVEDDLPEGHDESLSIEEQEKTWAAEAKQEIIHRIKRGRKLIDDGDKTPMNLLDAALKKLEHYNLDVSEIDPSDYREAIKRCSDIKNSAKAIEKEIFDLQKSSKKSS